MKISCCPTLGVFPSESISPYSEIVRARIPRIQTIIKIVTINMVHRVTIEALMRKW